LRPLPFLFFFLFLTFLLFLHGLLSASSSLPSAVWVGPRSCLSAPGPSSLLRGTTEMPSMSQGSGMAASGVPGLMLSPSKVLKAISPQPSHQAAAKASLKVMPACSCGVSCLSQPWPCSFLLCRLDPLGCSR
jgi:hypothetical protein